MQKCQLGMQNQTLPTLSQINLT
jgi:hypothetical protein